MSVEKVIGSIVEGIRHWRLLAVLALVVSLCLSSSAHAARIHQLLLSEPPPEGRGPTAIAVNQATHHFYVVVTGASRPGKVFNLEENGRVDLASPELALPADFEPWGLAVDNSGGPHGGDVYVSDIATFGPSRGHGSVQQFNAAGEATAVTITESSLPPNGTPQAGGLPPVMNPGGFEPRSLAVDASGDIYIGDTYFGGATEDRTVIDKFTPAGAFVAQFTEAKKVTAYGLAVDASGDIYVASHGRPEAAYASGLVELNASGECVPADCAPIDSAPISGVALDQAQGTVYAVGDAGLNEGEIREYDATTHALLGVTTGSQLLRPTAVAVQEATGDVLVGDENAFGTEQTIQTYGPVEVVPDVTTLAPEAIGDSAATLRGDVGAAEVPGATCAFQYVTAEAFAERGYEGAAEAPCEPAGPFSGTAMNAVSARVEGLQGGTTYRERIVGTNKNGSNPGQATSFTTLGPTVSETQADEVDETAATLQGTVDARGLAGSYVVQYVTQTSFEAGGWGAAAEAEGQIPLAATGSAELLAGPSAAGTGELYSGGAAVGSGNLEAGSDEVSAPAASEGAFEANQPITGEGIPSGTKISAIEGGKLLLSKSAEASGSNVALVAGSHVVASLVTEEGSFEVGEAIAGEGIPAKATITALGKGVVVLSAAAQVTKAGVALVTGSRVLKALHASKGGFEAGQTLAGPGIPADAKVVAVSSDGTEIGLSLPPTQTAAGVPLTATEPIAVSQRVEGLAPRTAYRFRIVAVSAAGAAAGTTEGPGVAFSTFSIAPSFGGCSNETLREEGSGLSAALPDCRAYEQVSPIEKSGANVQGAINSVQASLNGNGITFFANTGIPIGEGTQEFPTYLAGRASDGSGWSTQGLLPPASYGPRAHVLGWTEDLGDTYDFAVPAHGAGKLLRRSSADGAISQVGAIESKTNPFAFAASSSGGAVALLESERGGLLPGDLPGKQNLYAYDRQTGAMVMAGVMNPAAPGDEPNVPPGGAMAGSYNSLSPANRGGAFGFYFTQADHVISADGSKVFFTAGESKQIYVRVNPFAPQSAMSGEACTEAAMACTVRISAPESGTADPGTPAVFAGASTDGQYVYFLDQGKLTADATGGEGYDLYRYDTQSGQLSDVTHDAADFGGARVEGVLGMSSDGGTVYFVAAGKLTAAASQALRGETNLYVLEGDKTHFVARLGTTVSGVKELLNWTPNAKPEGGISVKTSRVSDDGHTLLFTSGRRLTAYDNHGVAELYLYRSGIGIACISCNPTGEAPAGPAGVQQIPKVGIDLPRTYSFMTRNLSANGRRVFFDSEDRLVAADENHVNDVYEWEAPGEGSCTEASSAFSSQDEGCLYLISGGARDAGPSYFGDADEEGENVFFFTAQQLVAQDIDELVDVYDARVGGGIAAQEALPAQECDGEAGCLGATTTAPGPIVTATPSFAGPGNARPPAGSGKPKSGRCPKGKVRRHGACVRKTRHGKHGSKHHGKHRNKRHGKRRNKRHGKHGSKRQHKQDRRNAGRKKFRGEGRGGRQ